MKTGAVDRPARAKSSKGSENVRLWNKRSVGREEDESREEGKEVARRSAVGVT
jgi:hypothetical protein